MRLSLIPRFAEILGLPARPAVQALRCRALTAGESICAVRRVIKRSVSLQKPPQASFQGCQEFIGSSMSAKPPPKSPQLLPQLNKRPERQWPLPLTRQRPQTFLYGQSGTGRLSFRLRKLQTSASKQAIVDLHVEGIIEYLLSM